MMTTGADNSNVGPPFINVLIQNYTKTVTKWTERCNVGS